MSPFRSVLVVVVLAQLALIAVFQRVRETELQYAAARRKSEIRALTREHQALQVRLSESRRPESLESMARSMGFELKAVEASALVRLSDRKKRASDLARRPEGRRP